MRTSPRSAIIAMLIGAVLISTTSIFVKMAHVGPTVSAFYRMALGGGILFVGLLALGQWQRLRLQDIGWLLIPAVAFAADLMLWHRSIRDVGPGLATLLGNLQVFMMALAGFLIYREHLGIRFLVGVALAFLGLFLLIGPGWLHVGLQYKLGVVYGIFTSIAYAAYMLSTRYVQQKGHVKLKAAQLLCISSILCAGLLMFAVVVEGDSFAVPDVQTWGALLGLALFGQVLGWVLIVYAMPQLPASLIGLLLLLQPALSFILDVIIFARPTYLLDWCGVALSLIGIFVGSYKMARPKSLVAEAV